MLPWQEETHLFFHPVSILSIYHSLFCPFTVVWLYLDTNCEPVIPLSGSHVWRFPDPAPRTQCALIPGPSLLWSLWRDAVRTGQTRAQVWRWGKWGDETWIRKDTLMWSTNFLEEWFVTLIKYAPSVPLSCSVGLLLPGSLTHAAPCRMWTKLPQALCIQHPKQLQRSSETASVHHLAEQQPVPASVHHWVGVQCRDGLHLHRGDQPHPLTHTNGRPPVLWSVLDYYCEVGFPVGNIYLTTSNSFVLS